MRIFGNAADDGGCGHYRVIDPLTALAETTDHSVGFMKGTFEKESEMLDFMQNADVFVLQRPNTEKQVAFFETFKKDSKLLIFEHDDNTWDLHPYSDHYRWHGTTDIAIPIDQYPGDPKEAEKDGKTVKDGMVWLWEHGKDGYNVIENHHKRRYFEQCLGLADVITCTTPKLAKLFRKKAKEFGSTAPVYDLPNCLDLRRWMPVDIRHEGIRILWQGGASHLPDLKVVEEALAEVCKEFPQVKIVIGGFGPEGIYQNIDPKQVEVYGNWVDFNAHPYRTALYAADIAIAPIADIYFNSFKSDVKYSEYAALKIPTVASNLTPYKESITHGKTGLLANTTAEWVKHLSALVKSETLRKELGGNARKWVEENRDVKKEAYRWGKTYQKELNKKLKNHKWSTHHSSVESKSDSTTPPGDSIPPTTSLMNSS